MRMCLRRPSAGWLVFPRIVAATRWHVACTREKARSADRQARQMALPFGDTPGARDKRTLSILAKTIYRELRSSGYEAQDVMALAAELLAQVTREVRDGSKPRE